MIPRVTTTSLQALSDAFKSVCGHSYVTMNACDKHEYGHDETLDLNFPFDILVKPGSAGEIASIMELCNRHKVPVTPRGGGSGVTGGALPVKGGVVLSLERLNRIISISSLDRYVVAESGVITAELCQAVEQAGLYFPVIPSSSMMSFIGGNVAENAGSIASCKYGITSQYVINLEIVLPSGEIIWTGANVVKNATGINLTQLFVGSEGILGIITKVVYRLLSRPQKEIFMLAGFASIQNAYNAVVSIRQSGVSPAAVELIGNDALRLTSAYLSGSSPLAGPGIKAQLLIGLHGSDSIVSDDADIINNLIAKYTEEEILIGISEQEKAMLSKLRLNIGNAMTQGDLTYRDVDACVPLSSLLEFIQHVERVCKEHAISVIYFGHALDGNLHTMLLVKEPKTEKMLNKALQEIYKYAVDLGGVISGEHGIGLLQKEYMSIQFSDSQLRLMNHVKFLFDPNNILNPSKVLL